MPAFTIRYSEELESNFDELKLLFNQSTKNKVIIELIKAYPSFASQYKALSARHDDLLAKHWELLQALRERDLLNEKITTLTQSSELKSKS